MNEEITFHYMYVFKGMDLAESGIKAVVIKG